MPRLTDLILGAALVASCSAGLLGCGVSTAQGPEPTLSSLAEALERGDGAALAALRRRAAPSAEVARDELAELGQRLGSATVERRAVALVSSADGPRTVVLVHEDGVFRVDTGILGLTALDTPESAIAALHRALSRELAGGVGPLLSDAERRAWLEERTRYRDGTADPEALDLRVEDDHATAATPLGDLIVLVREGGEWRVQTMRAAGIDDAP